MKASQLLRVKLGPRLAAAVAAHEAKIANVQESNAVKPSAFGFPVTTKATPLTRPPGVTTSASSPQLQSQAISAFMSPALVGSLFNSGMTKVVPSVTPPEPSAPATTKKPLRIAISRSAATGSVVRVSDPSVSTSSQLMNIGDVMSVARQVLVPKVESVLDRALLKHQGLGSRRSLLRSIIIGTKKGVNNSGCEDAACTCGSCSAQHPEYVGLVTCGVSTRRLNLNSKALGRRFKMIDRPTADGTLTTGINYALHRIVSDDGKTTSAKKEGCGNKPIISGLLKGCAEQNALGAFAAKGDAPFTDIRTVILHGRHVGLMGEAEGSSPPLGQLWWESMFPCRQCWAHMCTIAAAQQHEEEDGDRMVLCVTVTSADVEKLKTLLALQDVIKATGTSEWFAKRHGHLLAPLGRPGHVLVADASTGACGELIPSTSVAASSKVDAPASQSRCPRIVLLVLQ